MGFRQLSFHRHKPRTSSSSNECHFVTAQQRVNDTFTFPANGVSSEFVILPHHGQAFVIDISEDLATVFRRIVSRKQDISL
ncbi:hypothetical protein M378DRAFT_169376 [Amanita muscaria Koide BX008]|uniref:Uncharacterized protein n=1 Tax=Amanita muscaria (strain Koide BX008) TaxID=946122 RepID=A0A0C2WDI9_AMAMK|nr:hypothetical protein M378DRAFT_169376 [Amanita muscaria Koide BX008]